MTTISFRKVARDRLTDQVISEIRRMVLSGAIQPGEMLPIQPELAEQLGVGVATIRRAVVALSSVGLLDSQPGRGTTVNPDGLAVLQASALLAGPLDPMETAMIYEARQTIEARLTELAALRATPEDHTEIRQALEDMEATIDDEAAFTAADLRFHFAVARAGRNALLAQFYHVSRKLLTETIEKVVTLRGVKETALRLQWDVYEAIVAGDPTNAREAAIAQLRQVEELLERADLLDDRPLETAQSRQSLPPPYSKRTATELD